MFKQVRRQAAAGAHVHVIELFRVPQAVLLSNRLSQFFGVRARQMSDAQIVKWARQRSPAPGFLQPQLRLRRLTVGAEQRWSRYSVYDELSL